MSEDLDATILAVLRVISHPDQFRILRACSLRPESPRTLTTEHSRSIGQVAYHFRVLADKDLIELMQITRARGSIQHWYVATARGRMLLPGGPKPARRPAPTAARRGS